MSPHEQGDGSRVERLQNIRESPRLTGEPEMQGLFITRYGRPYPSLEARPLALPPVRSHEVRVRIEAFTVNPVDVKTRHGDSKLLLPMRPPFVPGVDLAGTIDAVGDQVRTLRIGDRVMAYSGMDRMGAYADAIVLPSDRVARVPSSVSIEHAAALPLVGLCALQAVEAAAIATGHAVLVLGGAGSVGRLITRMAVHRGARVIVSANPADAALVKTLGAERLVDYRSGTFPADLPAFDCVIDTAGGNALASAWSVLRTGGTVVSLHVPPSREQLEAAGLPVSWLLRLALPLAAAKPNRAARTRHATLIPLITTPCATRLQALAGMVDAGILLPAPVRTITRNEFLAQRHDAASPTRERLVVRKNA